MIPAMIHATVWVEWATSTGPASAPTNSEPMMASPRLAPRLRTVCVMPVTSP
jgi:hypothetical protein